MPVSRTFFEAGELHATARPCISAMRVCLGGSGMKLRTFLTYMAAAIVVASLAAGCGSKSAVNTVTVSISSSVGPIIIVGQSTTLTSGLMYALHL